MKHFKKLIALALIAMSILSMFSVLTASAEEYWYVNVPNGQTVNLRDSPDGHTIRRLPRGTKVIHNGTLGRWKKVITLDNVHGYILDDFLTGEYVAPSVPNPWDSRYGTTVWKKKLHKDTFYQQVQNLQRDLYKAGYTSVKNADGYYGTTTERAVSSFQRNNHLKVDGICGNKTKEVLWNRVH